MEIFGIMVCGGLIGAFVTAILFYCDERIKQGILRKRDLKD